MRSVQRQSTPKVVDGKVRKKNNWELTPDHYTHENPRLVVVHRERPGSGYKHVLTKSDIYRFLELLPDWINLAIGLSAVVLAEGDDELDGFHTHGVVHVCAWKAGLWREATPTYYADHRAIFERLGVACDPLPNGEYLCKFDERAVRAYQLLHILLHELGHHHDRMTTNLKRRSGRGERYAEEYAFAHESAIWDAYHKAFR